MAVAMIDGPAVKVQLERLGLSITDFAAYARMERADVSRALHRHPQQPSTLFRIAQALDELRRDPTRAVRGSMSSPAAALAGTHAGRRAAGVASASTLRPPLDDQAGIFTGDTAEALADLQFAVIRDPALRDHARRVMGEAMEKIIARHTAMLSKDNSPASAITTTQRAARRRT
jgi:hypothetical protein